MDAYSQTLDWIYNLRGGVINLRLDRMDRALALLGRPEQCFPALHIAGTNGKGSTAAMLHRILTLAGYRTGLYTSPHLVSFTERIRVGHEEISPAEVVALAQEIKARVIDKGVPLTFFEIVTVMAFLSFARRRIDIGVIEVGLGGRLDATNLVRPAVTMITTIAKDHEAYLGHDLLSIGREKAGIIKTEVPMVCGSLPPEVTMLVKQTAAEKKSPCYFLGADFGFLLKNEQCFDYKGIKCDFSDIEIALRGRHQKLNAALVLAALELAGPVCPVAEDAIRQGLKSVAWPGRFEIMCARPWLVLDGAHNGEGMNALAEALREFRQGRKIRLLFATMEDKDWRHMLSILIPLVNDVVLTRVQMERSAAPQALSGSLAGTVSARVVEDARSALRLLFQEAAPDDIVLVAGSLYLLGEIRSTAEELAART